jgi:hypothetical protein
MAAWAVRSERRPKNGDQPEVKARLHQIVDNLTDRKHCQELLEERALARDSMDATEVQRIREDMERAEARRLQPHFIESFFLEAFKLLGGSIKEREPRRYEITHVPALIRQRDRLIGLGEPILAKYERITFEKALRAVPGQPLASFVCPGHPLLGATIDLILERNRDLLKRGTLLVDPNDPGDAVRALFYLENAVQDGRTDKAGNRRVVSRQLQFVEVDSTGTTKNAGYAPYLDYRAVSPEELTLLAPTLDSQDWLKGDIEFAIVGHAISDLVPKHLEEVRSRREDLVTRTMAAVKDRLNKESAREKSIRHGHPSTLHLWWARRPLAACRAVLFASLVDDPSSLPEQFPTEADQDKERQRLFRLIEELVKWDNSNNQTVLKSAHDEILKSTGGNSIQDTACRGHVAAFAWIIGFIGSACSCFA